jgi:hypothetical protein
VELTEVIRASVSPERMPAAVAWARETGNGSIVKRQVSAEFGKGEDERAEDLIKRLTAEEMNLNDESSVHPSTLSAFVKTKLAEGVEIPIDVFGIFKQKVAKIKRVAQ